MHKIPFVRIAVSFAAGIVLHEFYQLHVAIFIVLAFVTLSVALITLLPSLKNFAITYNQLIGLSMMVCFFSLAYIYTYLSSPTMPKWSTEGEMVMQVKLLDAPQKREKSYRVEAEMIGYIENDTFKNSIGKVLLYFSKDIPCETWKPNDEISIAAKLNRIEGPKNPGEFDLATYNKRKGIYYRAFVQPHQIISHKEPNGWSFNRSKFFAKEYLLDISTQYFNSPSEKALSDALVLGYQDDLDEETVSRFSKSGTSHVLAVSGLHIGILWLLLDKVLLFFLNRYKWSRWLKFCIALSILWAYAFLTGMSPSVMRAAIMFSCFSFGEAMRQKNNSLNTLFISAFIQMLIEPMVLFNIGFQLSYAAVGSILIFYQPIRDAVYLRSKTGRLLWEMVALTLSAQILTTPISLYWFGQFPVWFIFSNLVLVPLSSLALILGLAAFVFAWVPHLSNLLFHLFAVSIKMMDSLAAFFAELPYALLHFNMGMVDVILLYALIVGISVFLIHKKVIWFKFSIAAISCILCVSIFRQLTVNTDKQWVIYSLKQGIVVRQFSSNEVLEYRSENVDRKTYSYSVKPSDKKFDVRSQSNISEENGFIQLGNKKIVRLNKEHLNTQLSTPISCNWIILESFKFIDFDVLQQNFAFEKLLIGSGNSKKSKSFWKKECIKRKIPFYDLSESGALIVKD